MENIFSVFLDVASPKFMKIMRLINSRLPEYNFVDELNSEDKRLLKYFIYKKVGNSGYHEINKNSKDKGSEDIHDILVIYKILKDFDWFCEDKFKYLGYVYDHFTNHREMVIDSSCPGYSKFRNRCILEIKDFDQIKNFSLGCVVNEKKEKSQKIDTELCDICGPTTWKEMSTLKFCDICGFMKEITS